LFNTFPAHVGKIGNYERCAFLTRGTGQFAPIAGANPTIGSVGALEQVEEDRVEVLVLDRMREVVSALKDVHPYEEVAYDVYKLEDY
ncbi:GTP cyclohydrolase 1 type 2/Nif3, partial [Mycena galopus ATCC 62051]